MSQYPSTDYQQTHCFLLTDLCHQSKLLAVLDISQQVLVKQSSLWVPNVEIPTRLCSKPQAHLPNFCTRKIYFEASSIFLWLARQIWILWSITTYYTLSVSCRNLTQSSLPNIGSSDFIQSISMFCYYGIEPSNQILIFLWFSEAFPSLPSAYRDRI